MMQGAKNPTFLISKGQWENLKRADARFSIFPLAFEIWKVGFFSAWGPIYIFTLFVFLLFFQFSHGVVTPWSPRSHAVRDEGFRPRVRDVRVTPKRSPKFRNSRKNCCSPVKTFAKISFFSKKRLFVNQNVRQNLTGYERVFKDLRNERVFKDLWNERIWYFS